MEAEAALARQHEAHEEERQAADATTAMLKDAMEKLREEGARLCEGR